MNTAVILLSIMVLAFAVALVFTRQQRDAARTSSAEFCKDVARYERDAAVQRDVAKANYEYGRDWKQQAVELSRRNHELTAIIAASKKQELLIDPDEIIPDPPTVLDADLEAARERRPTPVADKAVQPPPSLGNNDNEDDLN